MKLRVDKPTAFARVAAVALIAQAALFGCASSEEGPMLSDEEKLKRAQQGRQSYSQGGKTPQPPATSGSTGR
jgi:hypothetical protein